MSDITQELHTAAKSLRFDDLPRSAELIERARNEIIRLRRLLEEALDKEPADEG